MNSWDIEGHTLEYIDDIHQYLVDGVCVPSITQILKIKFGNKYQGISTQILDSASKKGTEVHEAIEKLCKTGEIEDFKEVKNFLFLQKHYEFEVLDNEVPIILFNQNGDPISAGRLDLVLKIEDEIGGADIKRTSTLDKEYLTYQLNLYRIGYKQSYGTEWKFLKGIHLREDKRKFIDIPINEEIAWKIIEEYFNEN
ncbi:MAG: hypothetical protein IJL74_04790 [Bacilli bacterium]|nr:hypothetical protein [Bacilli bacterium]